MAKANNQRAEDKAAELKQLNKSIFRPVIVWNKVRGHRYMRLVASLTRRMPSGKHKRTESLSGMRWNASTGPKL